MHRSFTPVILISLLSAGILAFCSAQPAAAAPAKPASTYVNCEKVARDVSLMVLAFKMANDYTISGKATEADWYARAVITHALVAVKSGDPAQYVRTLHKSCLLETT